MLNVAGARHGRMPFAKRGLPEFVDMQHRRPRWNPIRTGDEPFPPSLAVSLACRRFDVQKTADACDELFFRERYGQHRAGSLRLDAAAGDGFGGAEIEDRKARPQMVQVAVRSRLPAAGITSPITARSICG
jgi:hypothetical protein